MRSGQSSGFTMDLSVVRTRTKPLNKLVFSYNCNIPSVCLDLTCTTRITTVSTTRVQKDVLLGQPSKQLHNLFRIRPDRCGLQSNRACQRTACTLCHYDWCREPGRSTQRQANKRRNDQKIHSVSHHHRGSGGDTGLDCSCCCCCCCCQEEAWEQAEAVWALVAVADDDG